MSVSLDEFLAGTRKDLEDFAEDYRKHHSQNPEQYPLELPDENAGLWSEFFMEFHLRDGA